MLDEGKIEVRRILSNFGKEVVFNARTNFLGKNASGKGSKSIGYTLEVFPKSFSLSFEMEDYMNYQDQGVSGKKTRYNTPFRYTNKKPPANAFSKWSIRRGLAPRDESGRFKSRKSLQFALANYVFQHGIKPSKFFTKAFEREYRELPENIIEAYGLDLERFLKTTLDADR